MSAPLQRIGTASILIIAMLLSATANGQSHKAPKTQAVTVKTAHEEMQARQEELDKPKPVRFVEQMPSYPGDLGKWLSSTLRYPDSARAHNAEGKCLVQFIVTGEGKITNAFVATSSGNAYLDEEAMRVVKLMPPWKPGRHMGKPVDVFFTLPVTFKLD